MTLYSKYLPFNIWPDFWSNGEIESKLMKLKLYAMNTHWINAQMQFQIYWFSEKSNDSKWKLCIYVRMCMYVQAHPFHWKPQIFQILFQISSIKYWGEKKNTKSNRPDYVRKYKLHKRIVHWYIRRSVTMHIFRYMHHNQCDGFSGWKLFVLWKW